MPHVEESFAQPEEGLAHAEERLAHAEESFAHAEERLAHAEESFAQPEEGLAHVEESFAHAEEGMHTWRNHLHNRRRNNLNAGKNKISLFVQPHHWFAQPQKENGTGKNPMRRMKIFFFVSFAYFAVYFHRRPEYRIDK